MRGAAVLLALAFTGGAAAADCPEVITRAVWDDGHVSTVTGRKGDVAEMTGGPQGGASVAYRTQAGLIPLSADSDIGGRVVFDWATSLPGVADLVPGAAFDLAGTQSAMLMEVPVRLRIEVGEAETITVGACPYEVLRIESQMTEDGTPFGAMAFWLHMPSLMPLRQEMVGETGETLRVVSVE